MKSIRTKISFAMIMCTVLSILICGCISIRNSTMTVAKQSSLQMRLTCQNESEKLNHILQNISSSVDSLSALSILHLTNIDKLKHDKSYIDSCTDELKPLFEQFANNTIGAYSAYIRFNPDFAYPTSGLYYTKENVDSAFKYETPTDFSKFDRKDKDHVGWYYTPLEKKAPVWMPPYLNSNINAYMISYVVPIIIKNETIGVIGMDINFTLFQETVDHFSIFQSGYAFLADSQKNIVYHKAEKFGTPIKDVSPSLHKKINPKMDPSKTLNYSYKSKTKCLYASSLKNGMYFCLTVLQTELYHDAIRMATQILFGASLALVVAVIIGLLLGNYITNPIRKLKETVLETSHFNFTKTDFGEKLCSSKDEIGQMACSIHDMRSNLREITSDIEETEKTLTNSMSTLMKTSLQVSHTNEANSATTEELSAAMEETSATMESIESTMTSIKQASNQIQTECTQGYSTANEVRNRAAVLKENTLNGSKKTKQMYETLLVKTNSVIERAEAVEQINQLTNVILEISEQTNLLALNATIEATRAGEAGKGFQVVASEIGSLANQTASTTETIRSVIADIYEIVTSMSQCLKDCTDFLNANVLPDYYEFLTTSEHYADDAKNYAKRMSDIEQSIHSLSKSIVDITEAIYEVNITVSETATGITDIAEKAQNTTSAIERNNELIKKSDLQIQKLHAILDMFQLNNE